MLQTLKPAIHKLVLLLTADEMIGEDAFHQETRKVPITEPAKNTLKSVEIAEQ